jgi:hypothetical protein
VIGELIEIVILFFADVLVARWRFWLCFLAAALVILAAHLLVPERVLFWPIAAIVALGGTFAGILWDVNHIDDDFPHNGTR